jgi:hypothetical protein
MAGDDAVPGVIEEQVMTTKPFERKTDAGLEARRDQDMRMLEKAIPLVKGENEEMTFKDWLRRIEKRDKVMRELGVQRRAFVRNTLIAAQDAAADAGAPVLEAILVRGEVKLVKAKEDWSKEVRCGALPKYPPGMTAESRRGGEWRR